MLSVEPYKERFLELQAQGLSVSEVARRMGWTRCVDHPDVSRVTRALRLAKGSQARTQPRITIELAEKLAEAMDMDPWEIGL